MKSNNFKILSILLVLVLSLGIVGCGKSSEEQEDSVGKPIEQKEASNESKVDLTKVLKYKDFYAGDNSAVANIVNNLPGNIYNEGIELQTTSKPYEITINYKRFENINIRFEDDSVVSSSFDYVIKNNALILLSLIKNVDIINFNIDDGTTITYNRTDLVKAHKEDFGNNLEEIAKDKLSLESFIKTNKK